MGKVALVVIAVLAALTYKLGSDFLKEEQFTSPFPDFFWGPKSLQSQKEDTKIHPFKINVTDEVLNNLRKQLKSELSSGRFQPPLENIGFEYGFNTKYLKTVVEYWLLKYDWRRREKLLNQYQHFKTKIAGIDIHFQSIKSTNNAKYKKTYPLLIIHGWPGSIVEHQKLIPLLTDPKDSEINFEVIAPSLPGYGFSEAAVRPGLGPTEICQILVKLMQRLGHDKFYAHGGDWGSLIVKTLAVIYPEHVIGAHTVLCMDMSPLATAKLFLGSFVPSLFYTEEEQKILPSASQAFEFLIRESGYFHIQATKPDTVGVGLSLSPTALATYILEKFSTWTNADGMSLEDGGLTKKFTIDELLDNVMLYWVTNSATTSVRLYSEGFGRRHFSYGLERIPVKTPFGCVVPRHESFATQPRSIAQGSYKNIVSYTYAPDGGHFFGFEEPEFLAKDILKFTFATLSNAVKD